MSVQNRCVEVRWAAGIFAAAAFWLSSLQTCQALPPPVATELGKIEVTPSALWISSNYTFSGSPHNANDVVTYVEPYVYIVYYDQDRKVTLRRMNVLVPGDDTTVTLSSTMPANDNHNTPHVAISQNDGRIHLAYGMHAQTLRYRISNAGAATSPALSAASFLPEQNSLIPGGTPVNLVTYPKFVVEENSKKLHLFYRSGNSLEGDVHFATYDDSGSWGASRKVAVGAIDSYTDPTGGPSSPSRSVYLGDVCAFGDELHVGWGWRERVKPVPIPNHDIYYLKSSDSGATWDNAAGVYVSQGGGSSAAAARVTSLAARAVQIDYRWGKSNSPFVTVDRFGNPHFAQHMRVTANVPSPMGYHHYWWDGAAWNSNLITVNGTPVQGGNGRLLADRTSTGETLYLVITSDGRIKIFAAQNISNNGVQNWGEWNEIWVSQDQYSSKPACSLVRSGSALHLFIAAQKPAGSGESSPMDLLWVSLESEPE